MSEAKYSVAIIGGGRLGQHYIEVYQTLPNTEVVAVAEINLERRRGPGRALWRKKPVRRRPGPVSRNDPGHRRRGPARQVHQRGGHRLGPGRRQRRLHRQTH